MEKKDPLHNPKLLTVHGGKDKTFKTKASLLLNQRKPKNDVWISVASFVLEVNSLVLEWGIAKGTFA